MVYMMENLLQYLPYALVVGTVLLLMATMVLVTINHFRNEGQRLATYPVSKRKRTAAV